MTKWRDVWSEEDLIEELEDDEETRSYCKKCLARGYEIFMGPKILTPGEKRQEDYENWKMCPRCYDVVPEYEMEQETTISDVIERSDNPFEQGKFVSESIPKRSSPAGRKALEKPKRERLRAHDDDLEIDALLRIYGEGNVRVIK